MAKRQTCSFQLLRNLLISRRSHTVATGNLNMQPVLSVMRQAKDMADEDMGEKEVKDKNFWMKDPKTGNWIPESHFGEIDTADLREKFLPRKEKS